MARAATGTDPTAQRTGAGGPPGEVERRDVVEVVGSTVVVACAEVGAPLVTVLDAGAPGVVVGEGVGRAGRLLPDEHDVAATASARTASRGRLNDEFASQDSGQ